MWKWAHTVDALLECNKTGVGLIMMNQGTGELQDQIETLVAKLSFQ